MGWVPPNSKWHWEKLHVGWYVAGFLCASTFVGLLVTLVMWSLTWSE